LVTCFPASSTLCLPPIMEAVWPSFPAFLMLRKPLWTLTPKSRASYRLCSRCLLTDSTCRSPLLGSHPFPMNYETSLLCSLRTLMHMTRMPQLRLLWPFNRLYLCPFLPRP
jgi:hypothetical protein